ncbi:FkbM family methyltransferase [uncultured Brevundimonas sp.]|uniref:FkbM family methyltransferase n=1 Tax=uncultured Brevundimonas sp. TaxID=213418 RepID=UPI0030EC09DD|tara:strand:+ start:63261 stop:64169 length:909 start_codon:yes stop_codon:yes gene_type:complete
MSFLARVMAQPANLLRILDHPLNRARKLDALRRWLSWHIRSRLSGGDVLVSFVNGLAVAGRAGMTGAASTAYVGLNEPDDMALVAHALRPGDLFLDVGANIGLYTLLAAGVAGAQVIAFEPMPVTAQLLQRNVAHNGISALVTVKAEAVGRENGVIGLTSTGDDVTSRIATAHEGADQQAPMTTLDASVGEQIPTFLKIDVEGFEGAVLEGASKTLANPSLLFALIEINSNAARYGYGGDWIVDLMARNGMTPFSYDAFSRTFIPAHGANTESDNTLFVRDVTEASRRVKQAPSISVLGTII